MGATKGGEISVAVEVERAPVLALVMVDVFSEGSVLAVDADSDCSVRVSDAGDADNSAS